MPPTPSDEKPIPTPTPGLRRLRKPASEIPHNNNGEALYPIGTTSRAAPQLAVVVGGGLISGGGAVLHPIKEPITITQGTAHDAAVQTESPRTESERTPTSPLMSVRELAAELNALTDQAARTVQETEHYLNDVCSVGVPGYVEVPGAVRTLFLEYRRVGPKYRIAVVTCDDDGSNEEIKAWSDSTREDKLLSFPKLPALIEKITQALVEKIQATKSALNDVTAALKALPPGPRK